MNFNFDDDNLPAQLERKKGFFSETNLKVIAGTLAVIGGSLSFLGQHPTGYWLFIALAVVVFGWIFIPLLVSLGRRFILARSAKRYVVREFPRLKRFYERFLVFTSRNDTRGFLYLLYNSSTSQNPAVNAIIGFDYISTWIQCYAMHLTTAPRSIFELSHLCSEFTCVLAAFDRYYVIKLQQGLEKTPFQQDMYQDYYVKGFEQFRDDFVQYLREVEDWMNSVSAEAQKRDPNVLQHPQTLPICIFERPESFRIKAAEATKGS